ncbi:hypothetical protein MMC07_005691 [Pseudocyphellaria aurata]|nr:hypothetical protein [Pseudocyphellaria aurata]
MFGEIAEQTAREVQNGQRVQLIGRLSANEFVTREGEKRTRNQIIVNQIYKIKSNFPGQAGGNYQQQQASQLDFDNTLGQAQPQQAQNSWNQQQQPPPPQQPQQSQDIWNQPQQQLQSPYAEPAPLGAQSGTGYPQPASIPPSQPQVNIISHTCHVSALEQLECIYLIQLPATESSAKCCVIQVNTCASHASSFKHYGRPFTADHHCVASPFALQQAQAPAQSAEEKWSDLFSNYNGWFDNRTNKRNPKAPDFKKKGASDVALWLNSRDTPMWVKEDIHSLGPAAGNTETLPPF